MYKRQSECWIGTVYEDAEIMGKTWRQVKATAGKSVLALLCGGHML
jgi:hypothetical protein